MTPELLSIKTQMIIGMTEYMNAEPDYEDYDQEDINKCSKLIDDFFDKLKNMSNTNENYILESVEFLVNQLNELNEYCEDSLIETEQREELCEIINTAARFAGLQREGDITEDWRMW